MQLRPVAVQTKLIDDGIMTEAGGDGFCRGVMDPSAAHEAPSEVCAVGAVQGENLDAATVAELAGNSHRGEATVSPFNVSIRIDQPRHDLCVAMPASEDHERRPFGILAIRPYHVGEPSIGGDHVGVRSEQQSDVHSAGAFPLLSLQAATSGVSPRLLGCSLAFAAISW